MKSDFFLKTHVLDVQSVESDVTFPKHTLILKHVLQFIVLVLHGIIISYFSIIGSTSWKYVYTVNRI